MTPLMIGSGIMKEDLLLEILIDCSQHGNRIFPDMIRADTLLLVMEILEFRKNITIILKESKVNNIIEILEMLY
jgi:hypothetical protein